MAKAKKGDENRLQEGIKPRCATPRFSQRIFALFHDLKMNLNTLTRSSTTVIPASVEASNSHLLKYTNPWTIELWRQHAFKCQKLVESYELLEIRLFKNEYKFFFKDEQYREKCMRLGTGGAARVSEGEEGGEEDRTFDSEVANFMDPAEASSKVTGPRITKTISSAGTVPRDLEDELLERFERLPSSRILPHSSPLMSFTVALWSRLEYCADRSMAMREPLQEI
ncbi:hypothetical protein BS47DRAFT_1392858 [Hydnum rufescens UP504]|uniref:Uncharacterized protein n=1 Tax=Hydnum rufescens UP504 TaxID=1448309 RepID=A0A9P6AXS4_9AGAM|nr:hypothetical protein BS47DRAFT_1392858 [Hydnum rufescens UP504]